jgi:hypothetical protein
MLATATTPITWWLPIPAPKSKAPRRAPRRPAWLSRRDLFFSGESFDQVSSPPFLCVGLNLRSARCYPRSIELAPPTHAAAPCFSNLAWQPVARPWPTCPLCRRLLDLLLRLPIHVPLQLPCAGHGAAAGLHGRHASTAARPRAQASGPGSLALAPWSATRPGSSHSVPRCPAPSPRLWPWPAPSLEHRLPLPCPRPLLLPPLAANSMEKDG